MANEYYWAEREKRAQIAREHTAQMEAEFGQNIADKAAISQVFQRNHMRKDVVIGVRHPKVEIINTDTVSAIMDISLGEASVLGVLNFASFTNPGGKFIDGSRAQEESLCHESYLYNVLEKRRNDYYQVNRRRFYNQGLYTDRALYTPGIPFMRDDFITWADVLTCASPNWRAAQKYGVSSMDNFKALRSRIHFIIDVFNMNMCDTLVLGAFGCGVFQQDPKDVASCFKEALSGSYADRVIFAIPDIDQRSIINLKAFEKTFKNW